MKQLILFSGPEASGKTTLSLCLKLLLEQRGYKVRIVRIRGTHTLAFLLTMFLKKALKQHGDNLHYYKIRIPKKLQHIWLFIELISVIPLILLFYYLYRLREVVISERSILDLIVWVLGGLDTGATLTRTVTFKLMLILALKFKPFYVTAHVNELIKRKPNEKDLIFKLLPYYELFRKQLNLITIDTSESSLNYCINYLVNYIK